MPANGLPRATSRPWHKQSFSTAVLQAFANPEDALRHGGPQYCRSDPDVDRCLRQVPPGLGLRLSLLDAGAGGLGPRPSASLPPRTVLL